MTEPCDLPAVTARALIGERKLSPVELMDSCIRRIEEIDPAVNAVIARSFETARATAQESEAAVMRGDSLGPLRAPARGQRPDRRQGTADEFWQRAVRGQHRGRG